MIGETWIGLSSLHCTTMAALASPGDSLSQSACLLMARNTTVIPFNKKIKIKKTSSSKVPDCYSETQHPRLWP